MESPSSVKIKSELPLFTVESCSNLTVAGEFLFFQIPRKQLHEFYEYCCKLISTGVVDMGIQNLVLVL